MPDAPVSHLPLPWWRRSLRHALTWSVAKVFHSAALLGARLPLARPERHGLVVDKDIAYRDTGLEAHTLDIYRPTSLLADDAEPLPVVIYIHGGGFRVLSKDTHWPMALEFARRGYVVCSINYRLAPANPYPAAPEDVCAAWGWVLDRVADWGGDPSRVVVAGESAGANLTVALVAAACFERPEPWAQAVFARGVVPKAAVPACGILQVSDPRRFQRRGLSSPVNQPVIDSCFANYVGGDSGIDVRTLTPRDGAPDFGLVDPLCVIEKGAPARPLPPMYIPVGTADPLVDDTRRLADAVRRHGSEAQDRYFRGVGHSFHAWVVRAPARRCWEETHAFLGRVV